MTNLNNKTASLNELIEVLNDGAKFYASAARETGVDACSNLFDSMAKSKTAIVSDLKREVRADGGTPATGGTWTGPIRQTYADFTAKFSDKPQTQYVSQLEESEDRILSAFRETVAESDRPEIRAIAERHLPEVTRMHDEMRDLKLKTQTNA